MNNKLLITRLVLIIAPLLLACGGPKEENKNDALASSVSTGQKYNIDTKESSVIWKGSMLIGPNSHTGYVYMSGGNLVVENGQIVGGIAEVDMNTMEDEAHSRDNGLVDHLKSQDFFDVEKFPVATFAFAKGVSTKGESKQITGNLTIKGITHPVAFPAKVEVKDGVVTASGTLVIDRTQWGVIYQSGKFYDLLAEKTMSDSIEFQIKVIAKK